MKKIFILIIISIFIFNIGCIVKTTQEINKELPIKSEKKVLTQEDKDKIDKWIKDNNLNEYGDSKDTMYAGGTPLFNESTGKSMDRYEYILNRHPELKESLGLSIGD